jgi:hypothetical protein
MSVLQRLAFIAITFSGVILAGLLGLVEWVFAVAGRASRKSPARARGPG